ncbi:MAG: insulinase family protein [Acidobacteria bacterium]|nr:MAG: insulinase family protein [Acidobacteriota bacterium]
MSTACGWHSSLLRVAGPSEVAARLVRLLVEAATESEFAARDLERVRRARLATLARLEANPGACADLALDALLFPGRREALPLTGTVAGLEAVDGDDARSAWQGAAGRSPGTLLVVGALDRPEIDALVAASRELADGGAGIAGGTGATGPPGREEAQEPLRQRPVVLLVDRPHAKQTELRLGHAAPPRAAAGRAGRRILVTLLGGKFTSRLNLRLRETDGATYGVSAALVDRPHASHLVVSSAVETTSAARSVRGVLEEMERLRTEPATASEVSDSRGYIAGVVPYRLQTLSGLAAQLQIQWLFGEADDQLRSDLEDLAEVEPAEVLEAARSTLAPGAARVVLVGPLAQLRGQAAELRELGCELVELASAGPLLAGDVVVG